MERHEKQRSLPPFFFSPPTGPSFLPLLRGGLPRCFKLPAERELLLLADSACREQVSPASCLLQAPRSFHGWMTSTTSVHPPPFLDRGVRPSSPFRPKTACLARRAKMPFSLGGGDDPLPLALPGSSRVRGRRAAPGASRVSCARSPSVSRRRPTRWPRLAYRSSTL